LEFSSFASRIAFLGAFNSLSQLVLKVGSPGIGDFYQGTELWDLSLVDPDNRRPVDYVTRSAMLNEIPEKPTEEFRNRVVKEWKTGLIKLWITKELLYLRRRNPTLYTHGDYLPLEIGGPFKKHFI